MKKANSPSGLLKLSFVRLKDVHTVRIRGGVGYVTLKAEAAFEAIPFSSVSELNMGEAPFSANLNVPTPENENSRFLSSLVGVDCIFKLEMYSGVVYYLGSDRFPARLTYTNNNGGEVGQYAGYSVVVKSYDISLFKEYVIATHPVIPPDTPPVIPPVTPPAGSVVKIGLVAANYQVVGGAIVGAVQDPYIVQVSTNNVDYAGKLITYNSGDSFVFENKYAFPEWNEGISTHSPSYRFSKNYNIKCNYITISIRAAGNNVPNGNHLVYIDDDVDVLNVLNSPTYQQSVEGDVVTYKRAVSGNMKRITFGFSLEIPFTFEVLNLSYIV